MTNRWRRSLRPRRTKRGRLYPSRMSPTSILIRTGSQTPLLRTLTLTWTPRRWRISGNTSSSRLRIVKFENWWFNLLNSFLSFVKIRKFMKFAIVILKRRRFQERIPWDETRGQGQEERGKKSKTAPREEGEGRRHVRRWWRRGLDCRQREDAGSLRAKTGSHSWGRIFKLISNLRPNVF